MLKFYGHSDDCLEIAGHHSDELGAYDREVAILVGTREAGVIVRGRYAPGEGAVWCFSAEQVDEGVEVPWPMRYAVEHVYSLALIIDCPAGTPVQVLPSKGETNGR